jgi:hypothetical protein
MTGAGSSSHQLVGKADMRRVSRWGFPAYELTQDGEVLARIGRAGWLRIYMGRGQRIELADGARWKIRAIGTRGSMVPVILDSSGRKIAMAGSSHGTYGINDGDSAYVLYPGEKLLLGRANKWLLRRFEDELATITRHPLSIEATIPLHLGAVLLSFVLVRHGLPEDSVPGIPSFRWSQR